MPVPPSHGAHTAANSSGDRARMYSPLNARSFFTSKKAGEWLTSSSRNSSSMSDHGTISRSPLGAQPSSIR